MNKGKPVIIYRDNIFKRLLSHPSVIVREWTYSFIGNLEEASKKRVTQETENVYGGFGEMVGKRKNDMLPEYNFGAGIVSYDPATVTEILKHLDTLLYESMRDRKVSEHRRFLVIRSMAPLLRFVDYFTLAYIDQFEGKASFDEWMIAKKHTDTETHIKAIAISIHKEAHTRFVTTLDAVLAALIQEPLAEETKTTPGDIAKALSHLENFTALARVGSETYHIRPTPIPNTVVSGRDLWERKRKIQIQTWEKYCRKSEEVEQEMQSIAKHQKTQPYEEEEKDDVQEQEIIEIVLPARPRFEED